MGDEEYEGKGREKNLPSAVVDVKEEELTLLLGQHLSRGHQRFCRSLKLEKVTQKRKVNRIFTQLFVINVKEQREIMERRCIVTSRRADRSCSKLG